MSRQHAANNEVFKGFGRYFGLNMVFSVAISLHMTRYNTKTQKSYVKKDRKQEKENKYENGNIFLNLMKTVANLLRKKSKIFFLYASDLNILSRMSKFLHK